MEHTARTAVTLKRVPAVRLLRVGALAAATSTGSSQWISAPNSLRFSLGIRELARALLMSDTSVTHYGVDLVLDGRIEHPGTLPMSVESEERAGRTKRSCGS